MVWDGLGPFALMPKLEPSKLFFAGCAGGAAAPSTWVAAAGGLALAAWAVAVAGALRGRAAAVAAEGEAGEAAESAVALGPGGRPAAGAPLTAPSPTAAAAALTAAKAGGFLRGRAFWASVGPSPKRKLSSLVSSRSRPSAKLAPFWVLEAQAKGALEVPALLLAALPAALPKAGEAAAAAGRFAGLCVHSTSAGGLFFKALPAAEADTVAEDAVVEAEAAAAAAAVAAPPWV